MQRVIRTVVLAMLLTLAPPALSAHACPRGGSQATVRDGTAVIQTEYQSCPDDPPQPKDDPSDHVDPAADGHAGESAGPGPNSQGPSGPPRRTVSREQWAELLDQCKRGPNNDDLSPQCTAKLPDIAEDPTPAAPGAPTGPGAPTVTVAQVRESAIDQIKMGAPEVGASPCVSAADACRGTVGVPVWLWVGDGNGSLPSESATASAGPYTINATAKVSKVKWSLGDGQSTVCQGVGTKYDASRHGWSSPACGFDNGWKQAGSYTLTATYVWDISWTGDEAGSATQSLSTTQRVTVGELQSVVSTG